MYFGRDATRLTHVNKAKHARARASLRPVVRLSRRLDRVGVVRADGHDELSSAHQIRKMTIAPVVDMYVKHLEVEYSI